ncbi:MAG: SAM-dependent methyltransferase [Paracoccaceae bacterium]|nr:SAM-dependent methyltransferase [Paracoccaceae bacterium]
MTALAASLAARIAATGPISLADYMAECLLHPDHGYYSTRDPFGKQGDFTPAPEISQMFGELAGLCLAGAWLDQGRPADIVLAEPGPGRGTLMADILRATRGVPGFHAALRVHLVEASPVLRARQKEALQGHDVAWHDSLHDLPEAPLFLVANEFFDALPIRQFQRDPQGWRERVIGLADDMLSFGLTAPAPHATLEHRLTDTAPGEIVEVCPAAGPLASAIAGRIARHGGAAVIVDYGGWHSRGDTFQALSQHGHTDPLAAPGQADLTAHVDFEALALAARAEGAAVSDQTPQGVWLERLGITERARTLARGMTGAALEAHVAAHRRLTHPEEMGTLFKALAIYPKTAPVPPGFA